MNTHQVSFAKDLASKTSFLIQKKVAKMQGKHKLTNSVKPFTYCHDASATNKTILRAPRMINNPLLNWNIVMRSISKRMMKSQKKSYEPNRYKTTYRKKISKLTSHQNKSTIANHRRRSSKAPPILQSQLGEIRKRFQRKLLKARTMPIPRWITPRHNSFTISELCGHGSFILVAIAYAVDDYMLLRVMAVAGSSSMLIFTFFHPHGRVQWLPFKWNALFIAINLYRIGKVLYEKYMAEFLDNNLLELHRTHLPLVDLTDFAKLMKIGTVEVFEPGETMFKQGEICKHIRIIMDGDAVVYRDGVATYSLCDGNFISESGMHSGLEVIGGVESCATAKARKKVTCVRWNRTQLMELCLTDKKLYRSLQFALCWDIVRKLKYQRNFLIREVADPEEWTIKRKEQTDSRYASILENILQHHGHLEEHLEQLKNYRVMHQIDDEQHLKALKHCGWTPEEYEIGRKGSETKVPEEMQLKRFVSKLLN